MGCGEGHWSRKTRGRNSGVECQLPKLDVTGSNPVARSEVQRQPPGRPTFPDQRASGSERAMAWTSKRVVVTGAGGFIGSHLAEQLVRAGAEVTAVVRYNSRGDDGNLRYVDPAVRQRLAIQRVDLADPDA